MRNILGQPLLNFVLAFAMCTMLAASVMSLLREMPQTAIVRVLAAYGCLAVLMAIWKARRRPAPLSVLRQAKAVKRRRRCDHWAAAVRTCLTQSERF